MNFWDERFAGTEYVYGTQPNAYFKSFIDTMDPGHILLPGEGEGRNALYALQNGWQVTAVDSSNEGRRKAKELAVRHEFDFTYEVSDIEMWSPDQEFDSVALIYLHLPPTVRNKVHAQLIDCLKPGGNFIMEAFSKDQLGRNTGGPPSLEMLYDVGLLENDFRELKIKQLEQKLISRNEGKFHQGEASVIQLQAQKSSR